MVVYTDFATLYDALHQNRTKDKNRKNLIIPLQFKVSRYMVSGVFLMKID